MSGVTRTIRGLENIPEQLLGCVLTIGNFDGVHLGHRRIVRAARLQARAAGAPAVMLTFDPPPGEVLRPGQPSQCITPFDCKAELLLETGADWVIAAETTPQLLAMTPEDFIDRVIVEKFHPRCVVEGRNFFFGRHREGSVNTLRHAGQEAGFDLHLVEPLSVDFPGGRQRVSSSLIRRLLSRGAVQDANRCLGDVFTLHGRVIPGEGRGRTMELPTANLGSYRQIVPADGVYAGRAALPDGSFPAAVSIGNKPTLGPADRTIESYLIGAGGTYYDQPMALSFVARLRDQIRFDSLDELRDQIEKDVKRVREICG